MLEAYFDESGIHADAKVCVVAGFYSRQAPWRRFERQWNAVLSKHPELKDKGFHAKVFFARANGKRVGPYRDWSDAKAQQFLNHLLKCINDNWIFPVGFGVVVPDFLGLPLTIRQWLTGAKFLPSGEYVNSGCPQKSYYVPFQFCVMGAGKMSSASQDDKIHFFAGLDRTFSGYASEMLRNSLNDSRLPEALRSRLGSISFPLSKDTPGIQAADLLAYRMYRHSLDLLKDPETPTPALLTRLCTRAKKNQRFTLFTTEMFRLMEEQAQKEYNRIIGLGTGV